MARLAHHPFGREIGALDENIARGFPHGGLAAAHDASQGQGATVIGNNQGIRLKGDLLIVQQAQFLALAAVPDANPALEPVGIKGMQWLTQFQQDVIRDIDNHIQRAHTGPTQAFLHPQRSGSVPVDPANQLTQIARAVLGGVDTDRQSVLMFGGRRRTARQAQGYPVQQGDLAGNALDAQTIRPIRGEINLDQRIVELQIVAHIGPDRRILRQLHQAGGIFIDAEFPGRAQHAK